MAQVHIAADLSAQYFSVNVKHSKHAILQIHLIPARQAQHNDNTVAFSAVLIVQAFSTLRKVG